MQVGPLQIQVTPKDQAPSSNPLLNFRPPPKKQNHWKESPRGPFHHPEPFPFHLIPRRPRHRRRRVGLRIEPPAGAASEMEAGLRLRALGHRYYSCGGFKRGGLAAARGERRRRVGTASCSPAFCSLAASGNGNGAAVGPVGSGAEVACARRMLHVVLVSPLIPGNTGSIARTCAASAVGLHLVGPLGFNVDDTKLKRAGLDYWPYVVVKIHDSWDDFRDYFVKQEGEKRLLAFTKRGTSIHSDFSYKPGDWLVFGSETKGLPQQALEDCSREGLGGGTIRIPMVETYVRCLNLSVSVGIALYEAARQLNYEQLQYQPELPEEAQGLFPAEDIYA